MKDKNPWAAQLPPERQPKKRWTEVAEMGKWRK